MKLFCLNFLAGIVLCVACFIGASIFLAIIIAPALAACAMGLVDIHDPDPPLLVSAITVLWWVGLLSGVCIRPLGEK